MRYLSGWLEKKMNKVLVVASREYFDTIKGRGFIIGTLITMIFMVVIIFAIDRESKGPRDQKEADYKIAVTDLSGTLMQEMKKQFEQHNASKTAQKFRFEVYDGRETKPGNGIENLKNSVLRGELDAYLVIGKGILEKNDACQFYIKTGNIRNFGTMDTVHYLLNQIVINTRYRLNNLSPELIQNLQRPAALEPVELGAKSQKKSSMIAVLLIPFFFMYLIFLGIVGSGQQLLTSIVEEKSSRVIEVLLSSLTSFQLMTGKILGLAAVGLTSIVLWVVMLSGFAAWKGFNINLNPTVLVCYPLYFILGFLLVTSLIAAIASTCNTIRDAQSYMAPLMICFIVPMMIWFNIAQHPNSTLAVVLSFIPIMTPMIMVLRLASSPDIPLFQVIASFALLIVSLPLVIALSAKIFRTGILMYGKQPTPREILKWLRYK